MKKMNKQKVFIIVALILSLVALFFLFKNFFLDIIKFQINNDTEGMKAFIEEKGLVAPMLIISMEAIQMMCVFISVEFLQTATAMSYPWYYAALICELGVALGATLIYILVHLFKFDSSIFKNNSKKIESMNKDNKQLMMYLLFITPIVPFGFICYYGAKQKLGFKKYLFTSMTGVLPDIFIITLLGNIIKYVIINDIPFWIVIIAVILFMAILFLICGKLFKKAKKNSVKNTPDSSMYSFFYTVFRLITKNRPKFDKTKTFEIDGPFIVLTNHPSFYDMYYMCRTIYPVRSAFIMNRFYFKNKILRKMFTRMGVIPKKIFSPDIETIKKSMRTIKNGYPVYMCPEGRLSVDGTNYEITVETAKFIKQNKVPVVIINIQGAYLVKPKWRKKQIKGDITTSIKTIISKEDVINKSLEEITDIINDGISYNDFEYSKENNIRYKYKHKALGLENILYYCPHCHKEHTLFTKGNKIMCKDCGFELEIDENYWFKENDYNINNIHEWYKIIEEYERKNIDKGIDLKCDVIVKKHNLTDKSLDEEGKGVCYLTNNQFTFEGDLKVGKFVYDINNLGGLAFSAGEEFECYFNNELYYFYPTENRSQCCKWALIVDQLHEVGDSNEQ